jgi:2,3-dihydroxybenzoate decarboxylase
MQRIALEEHVILDRPEHVERWLTMMGWAGPQLALRILPTVVDVGEKRQARLAAGGVDMAVLSSLATVQGVLDPTPALRIAREANDYMAKIVQQRPDRYAGFATVPLQDPKAGADELERAVRQLGLKGTMIFGQTNGRYLDHDSYSPFWERAQALDVPVYLHATDALIQPVTYDGRRELLGPTWSWTPETAAHTLRLIYGGVFTRFPRARVILGHMGETLPFLTWRLDTRTKHMPGPVSQLVPSEILRRNVAITTSGMFSDGPLACGLTAMGEDNIMYSIDDPFESTAEAEEWFKKAPIAGETREKIAWKNAARMLHM